jgi:hypothetical protein
MRARAAVQGVDRSLVVQGGKFEDAFGGYEVELYRIR